MFTNSTNRAVNAVATLLFIVATVAATFSIIGLIASIFLPGQGWGEPGAWVFIGAAAFGVAKYTEAVSDHIDHNVQVRDFHKIVKGEK